MGAWVWGGTQRSHSHEGPHIQTPVPPTNEVIQAFSVFLHVRRVYLEV